MARKPSPPEPEDDLAPEDREKLSLAVKFKTLFEHPGWKALCLLVEKQGSNLATEILSNPTSDVAKENFAKGTLCGLNRALSLPSAIVQEAEDIRRLRSGDATPRGVT